MKPLNLKGLCFLYLSCIMVKSRSPAAAGIISDGHFFFPWFYFLDLMDSFT